MHVGVVTTSYPRFAGDSAGSFVHGLNRYLHRCGHEVTVACAGDRTGRFSEQLDGVTVHRMPSSLFFQGGAPDALANGFSLTPVSTLWAAGRFSGELLRTVAKKLSRCDAIVSHWLVPCGIVATLLQGIRPHVAIAHSSDVHLLRRLRAHGIVRWISRRTRLVYSGEHLQIDGAPGVVVPMGIETAEFVSTEFDRREARRQLGLSRPMVLFLGRLVPVKGVEVLLSAITQISVRQPIELIVAGDGPARASLAAVAAQQGLACRFIGEVSGPAKRQLLWAADALALPSLLLADGRTEGSPVVVWEALAAGCPVVASRVGGVPRQLDGAGLLVPAADARSLATALERVLFDPTCAAELREKGQKRAQVADWLHIAPRVLGDRFATITPRRTSLRQ